MLLTLHEKKQLSIDQIRHFKLKLQRAKKYFYVLLILSVY